MTGTDLSKLKRGRRYRTFYWLGEACHQFNIDLIVTGPNQIVSANKIHGWSLFPDKHQLVLPFADRHGLIAPSIVYDAMYLSDLKMYRRDHMHALRRLGRLSVPVFNPMLPNKTQVFKYIEASLSPNLSWIPVTKYKVDIPDIMGLLESGKKIWVKPVVGSGGRNMLQVQKVDVDTYRVIGDRFFERHVKGTVSKHELVQMLRYALRQKEYFAQQHVSLIRTQKNRPVDFRITVQRDETGAWQAVGETARVGKKGASVTNYHAGGKVLSVTRPSKEANDLFAELGMANYDMHSMIQMAISTARMLQEKFPLLGLLGIDVGRSVTGEHYVYDCNSRPGRDILTDEEVQKSMNYVAGFTKYLIYNYHLNSNKPF